MEHAAQAPEWAAALEASWIGVFMRQSVYAYPLANLLHLLGLTLLVGPILLLDLRALGVGARLVAADAASRLVTPFAGIGLALSLVTGPLLFVADAKSLATSTMLIAKLTLLAFALANALLFRALWNRRLPDWDRAPPLVGRAQAGASIALWLMIGGLGRMIAYL